MNVATCPLVAVYATTIMGINIGGYELEKCIFGIDLNTEFQFLSGRVSAPVELGTELIEMVKLRIRTPCKH